MPSSCDKQMPQEMKMKLTAILTGLLALTACASSPEYVARQGNFDVCRLTMGGPHAKAAETEAHNRGLDCQQLYPAISAKQAQENAATQQYLRTLQPPQIHPP